MAKQKSIKVNFLMNAVLSMSSLIFPLITVPYVTRILLPLGTGKVSFATSLVTYFLMFSQLGIPTYGIVATAKVRDDRLKLTRTVHELLAINIVMAAVSYILFFITLAVVPDLKEDRTLYIITSAMLVLSAFGMEWMYKGLEEYSYITIRSVIFKFIGVIAMLMLVKQQKDYVIYGAIAVFAAYASNLVNLVNAHKYIEMKPVGGYNFRQHFKAVGIFFAMSCATTIYTNLDVVMLGFMTTKVDVGYYDVAVKIKNILVSIVTSLGAVLLPRSSYYVKNGMMDEFRKVSRKALNFVFIFAVPLALYFMIYAKQGIYFISGTAYEGSILPMILIMPTLLFIGLTNIMGMQMLIPQGKEKMVLYSEIAGAVTDLFLNAILIPKMGASGAAIGTTAAEFVVLAVQYVSLKDTVSEMLKSIQYWKIIIGLVISSAASVWLINKGLGNFVTLLITAVIFFTVYLVILTLTKEKMTIELEDQILRKFKIRK